MLTLMAAHRLLVQSENLQTYKNGQQLLTPWHDGIPLHGAFSIMSIRAHFVKVRRQTGTGPRTANKGHPQLHRHVAFLLAGIPPARPKP